MNVQTITSVFALSKFQMKSSVKNRLTPHRELELLSPIGIFFLAVYNLLLFGFSITFASGDEYRRGSFLAAPKVLSFDSYLKLTKNMPREYDFELLITEIGWAKTENGIEKVDTIEVIRGVQGEIIGSQLIGKKSKETRKRFNKDLYAKISKLFNEITKFEVIDDPPSSTGGTTIIYSGKSSSDRRVKSINAQSAFVRNVTHVAINIGAILFDSPGSDKKALTSFLQSELDALLRQIAFEDTTKLH